MSVTIARPVSDVYRVLTTPELTPRWSSNAIEEHVTTPGPIRVGFRRRATVRRMGGGTTHNEIEVTALEPERSIAVRSVEAPVSFSSSWTFTPVDGGTRVDWHWDFAMRGWLRPFDGLLARTFTRAFRRDLARLRSMMEAGELCPCRLPGDRSRASLRPIRCGRRAAIDTVTPTIEQVIAAIPAWAGRAVPAEPIAAGLTNANWRVEVDGDAATSSASRAPRPTCSRSIARTSGTTRGPRRRPASAPPVLHELPDWDVFVLEWVDGRTMSNEALGAPGMPTRVAEALRRLHAGPRFRDDFDMFRLSRALPARSSTSAAIAIPAGYREHAAIGSRGSRPPWPSIRWPPSRATTTCWPRTTSTTASGCGSSTTSTAATTTRPSSSATRARSWAGTSARIARAVRRLLRRGDRRPARPDAAADDHVGRRLDAVGGDPGRDLDDRLRLLRAGPRSAGRARDARSTAPTSTDWLAAVAA